MTEKFGTPAMNTIHNTINQGHIMVNGKLLAGEGDTKIPEGQRAIIKRSCFPNISFSSVVHPSIVNFAFGRINNKTSGGRESMKLSHDQFNRDNITTSKNKQIISKAKVDNVKILTLGVEVKVWDLSKLLENYMKVFHKQSQTRERIWDPLA
jgi:hypothetical protein